MEFDRTYTLLRRGVGLNNVDITHLAAKLRYKYILNHILWIESSGVRFHPFFQIATNVEEVRIFFAKINVLNIDCEGCEWEMLPQMLDENFIQQVQVINLSVHNYPQHKLQQRVSDYCVIHQRLSATHVLHKKRAYRFAWERWVKK